MLWREAGRRSLYFERRREERERENGVEKQNMLNNATLGVCLLTGTIVPVTFTGLFCSVHHTLGQGGRGSTPAGYHYRVCPAWSQVVFEGSHC